MKCSIGLDLRPTGRGALEFARWMAEHAREAVQCRPVHVMEESDLLRELRHLHRAELETKVRAAIAAEVEPLGLPASVLPAVLRPGRTVDEGLAAEADEFGSDALIIGRRASTERDSLVRLGRAARRVLRRLPRPVVVVPGDLRSTDFGDGAILLATDLRADSDGAAVFARQLAALTGRPLAVVHVIANVDNSMDFVPAATVEQLYHQLGLERGRSLAQWVERHGLQNAATALATGDVISRLLGIAAQERSPCIVCGSRRLSTAERVFTASVGSTLAAFADRPVAVVGAP